jgi:hypothetical protein
VKLVATPNGSVDHYDRAVWLTVPFDLVLRVTVARTMRRASVADATSLRRTSGSDDTMRRLSETDSVLRKLPESQ